MGLQSSRIRFGMYALLCAVTIACLWLGAVQCVRFARLHPLPVALIALVGTVFWFRSFIRFDLIRWEIWALVTGLLILFGILLLIPSVQ